jgi:hypothetical protein
MRKRSEVVADWADALSQRLNRSVEEITSRGLSASDFSPSRRVRLQYADGSSAEFRYAFACISKETSRVAISTEHCGYLEFRLLPVMAVIEVREDYYHHESP